MTVNSRVTRSSQWKFTDRCYKENNDPQKIAKALDDNPLVKQQPNEGFKRRQRQAPFDFKFHCLICEGILNFQLAAKNGLC